MKNDTIATSVEATAPDSFKIVINTCYGGFGLSDKAEAMWREAKGLPADEQVYRWSIERDDADLVRIVEELGTDAADGRFSKLKVVEVPMWLKDTGWHIGEYDGVEHVAEDHGTWS